MDPNTIRVAVFPGGGARGYCGVRAYENAQLMSGLTPSDFADSADVMCGTSIGSISACAFRTKVKTPAEMKAFLRAKAPRIFTSRTAAELLPPISHNASTDSLKLTATQKVALMAIKGEAFYASPYSDSNYGHNILHNELVSTFNDMTLMGAIAGDKGLLVPAVNLTYTKLDVFANFVDTFYVSDASLVDICRASSAAPYYLPRYQFPNEGAIYWDGGLAMNDPVAQGILLGMRLKPRAKRIIVITYGTGYGTFSFDDVASLTDLNSVALSDAVTILNTTMHYNEENYERLGEMLSGRNINEFYYYKFNPFLDPDVINSELDNSSVDWFNEFDTVIDEKLADEQGSFQSIVNRWMF